MHYRPEKKIHSVAVVIAHDVVFSDQEIQGEHLLFTKTLAEELIKKKFFEFKILDKRYASYSLHALEQSLLGTELMDSYDAVLICIPQIRGRSNYRVDLKLLQTTTSKTIITAHHQTGTGNSYWLYQSSASTLIDATRGALDAMNKKWEKL